MQRPKFVEGEIYHIYNRGVEKRNIFLEDQDYFRFIHDLFEFNDEKPAENIYYKQSRIQSYEVGLHKGERELIVELLAFCLMPNHFHLMIKEETKNGITEFMRKLGTGYTNFFNNKYKRVGPLFQGKFKAVLINRESHFIHLPFYIHSNPLDLVEPGWREGKISNIKKAISFLEDYRWSSYADYNGRKNFPSLTQREFLLSFFGGPGKHKKAIRNWLKDIHIGSMRGIILEG